jgi:hypothetical protein
MTRCLTDREGAILALLLAADFEGAAELREQARAVVVDGERCPCGCPTISLAADHASSPQARGVAERVPVAAMSNVSPAEVMLFVDDGWLSLLEFVWYGDGDAPPEFPSPDTFAAAVRQEWPPRPSGPHAPD